MGSTSPTPVPEQPTRRVLHLEDISDPALRGKPPVLRVVRARRSTGALLTTWDGWLCLAERTLGGWASTLHGAFLMLLGITGFVVLIGVAFGFAGVVLGLLLGVAVWSAARPSR